MLRNLIFSIIFFSGIVLISFIFLPALLLPKKIVLYGGKLMGYWTGFCLKKILSVEIEVIGKENIIQKKNFLSQLHISQCLKLFIYKQYLIRQFLF